MNPTNIRDPEIPVTLGAFRALQDEVRRLDAVLRGIALSYPTTDEGETLADIAREALGENFYA